MALFKSAEEKKAEEERKFKEAEEEIINTKMFYGKVGATHTGWNFSDGLRNADKTKFKATNFKIFEDKILIERNRQVIQISQIKEIFYNDSFEAIIILNNDNGIPIQALNDWGAGELRKFKAFIKILNKLVEDNKSNATNTNSINNRNSEDKIDKLLKLGEMHDKGLLSDEEFDSLKQELLSGDNAELANTPVEDVETPGNICENCGAEVEEDSKFCSECGSQIK